LSTQLTQQRITDAGGREFRFRVDLYSQESTFPLVTYLLAVVAIAQFTLLLLLLLLLLMLADVAGVQEVRSSSLWVR